MVTCSDRLIDAIPGTYDEVKGKKYEGVNRLVDAPMLAQVRQISVSDVY